MTLDYFALGILVTVVLVLVYGVIALCDIPYRIARSRNHPHQDAIQVAGWLSLFTLHALWPLLWIWAMLYRPDRGWGVRPDGRDGAVADLDRRVRALESPSMEGR